MLTCPQKKIQGVEQKFLEAGKSSTPSWVGAKRKKISPKCLPNHWKCHSQAFLQHLKRENTFCSVFPFIFLCFFKFLIFQGGQVPPWPCLQTPMHVNSPKFCQTGAISGIKALWSKIVPFCINKTFPKGGEWTLEGWDLLLHPPFN